MQIEALRYFIELAQTGSFYRASKRVYLSQQGLNRSISSIEAELGVKLIERSGRGVRLTESGEVFLEHAQAIRANYSEMLDQLYERERAASPNAGRTTIHVTYYLAQIAKPFISGMHAYDSVGIVEEPFQQLMESARKSDGSELFFCDLFGAHERAAMLQDFVFEPLVSTWSGVIWHDGSPIGGTATVHREQLADIPLAIDSHREMTRLARYIMQDYPLNNIRMGVANPQARLEYAAESDDVALLFDSFGFMLAQSSDAIATEHLNFTPFSTPRAQSQLGLLYHKQARPSVRARHSVDRLRQHLENRYPAYFGRYPTTP